MTSRSAQRRRRCVELEESFVVGWCAGEEEITAANKETHDALLLLLGDRRRGGVTWRVFVDDQALGVIDRLLGAAVGPEMANHYRRLRGMLREFGGCLVVASAPCVPS